MHTYVLFGSTIKVLQGLVIGDKFLLTDYFDNLEEAQKKVSECRQTLIEEVIKFVFWVF